MQGTGLTRAKTCDVFARMSGQGLLSKLQLIGLSPCCILLPSFGGLRFRTPVTPIPDADKRVRVRKATNAVVDCQTLLEGGQKQTKHNLALRVLLEMICHMLPVNGALLLIKPETLCARTFHQHVVHPYKNQLHEPNVGKRIVDPISSLGWRSLSKGTRE